MFEFFIFLSTCLFLTSLYVRSPWRVQHLGSPTPSEGNAWSNIVCRSPLVPSELHCSSGGLASRCCGSSYTAAVGGAWPETPGHLYTQIHVKQKRKVSREKVNSCVGRGWKDRNIFSTRPLKRRRGIIFIPSSPLRAHSVRGDRLFPHTTVWKKTGFIPVLFVWLT